MENFGVSGQEGVAEPMYGNGATEINIGDRLVAEGKLKREDVHRVIALQEKTNLRFGEAAVQLGLAGEDDIKQVLAEQFDYQYLADGQGHFSNEIFTAYQPFSTDAEVLRKLRTQLQLRWFNQGHKGLVVLSPAGGEGVSRLTANLAVAFAQSGKKTLLIDANMRSPRQHVLFNLGRRAGLSEVLGGRADSNCISQVAGLGKLWILGSGATPPNPAELLVRPQFSALMKDVLEAFDIVLIDAPPAMQAPDFQTIAANQIQGVLLVNRKDHTKFSQVEQIQEMVAAVGATMVGGVINYF